MKKKFLALVLACLMVLGLCTSAFAADLISQGTVDGVIGVKEGPALNDNTIRLLKELVIHNTDGKDIYLPSVTYNYTVRPANADEVANMTVTDADEVVGVVYQGPSASLTTTSTSVVFAPNGTNATAYTDTSLTTVFTQPGAAESTGTSVYKSFDIAFNTAGYTHPGVYRYVITEASTNRTTAGVVTAENAPATNNVRYLDVYVRGAHKDANGQYDQFNIYGYVCFINDAVINADDTSNVAKTNGYVHTSSVTTLADQYYTKNLEVEKQITGGVLAETGHEFPFTITIASGPNGRGAVLNAVDTTGTVASGITSGTAVLAESTVITAGLSHEKTVTLYGIPTEAGATVTVKENNDTYDAYTLAATTANSTVTDISAVNGIIPAKTESSTTSAVAIDGNAMTEVHFVNSLTEISPTGVVFRFAPYLFILAAGLTLMVVARRRREEEEA